MKLNIVRLSAIALCATAFCTAVQAAAWSSSDRWATWSNGGYIVRNDVWSNAAGPQSIWANSGTNWGIWSNQPNTGGVKSYAHDALYVGQSTNNINYIGTWFSVSRPGDGAYETAFDIWLNNNSIEIMLWMNQQGPVGPIGSAQAWNQSIGGQTWNVYRGSNGSNAVYSFVRTSNTNSVSTDEKAIFNWLQSHGWFNNPYLGEVQFGFEVTSSSGGRNFTCNGRSDWRG